MNSLKDDLFAVFVVLVMSLGVAGAPYFFTEEGDHWYVPDYYTLPMMIIPVVIMLVMLYIKHFKK